MAKVLNENFGVERGFMTTIHSYTPDQRLLDNSHKDLRRSRSAPNSIIPTTTGATKSLGDVMPELKGKVEGISIRVPTPNVSLVEFVFSSSKNLTAEEINNSFLKAPEHLKGKVSLLYDLCLVIWADGKVVKEEKELLEKVIIQCNFEKENAQEVGRYLLDKVKKGTTLKEIIEEIVANPNTQES